MSHLPDEAIEAVRLALDGKTVIDADAGLEVTRSLPHGQVAAVPAQARAGWACRRCWARACRERDLAYALVVSRVARPASKLSTIGWWGDTTLGCDLGVAGASTDEVYAAMDWLAGRQDAIEAALAGRHLRQGGMAPVRPVQLVGGRVALRAGRVRAFPRRQARQAADRVRAAHQPDGCPVAVRVFAGNTADPKAFIQAAGMVRDKFHITEAVMVGDRGMITSARIKALKEVPGMAWLTCLRAPAIRKLADDGGPLQMSLFDQQDLAEISPPRLSRRAADRLPQPCLGRRARRAPGTAAGRHRSRATPSIKRMVDAGRLNDPAKIGVRVGKVINKRKVAKHFITDIGAGTFTWRRDQDNIGAEAALDGIYVIRTPVPAAELDARPRWPPTKTSPMWSRTSGSAKMTWTCAPSGTGSKTASEPTC